MISSLSLPFLESLLPKLKGSYLQTGFSSSWKDIQAYKRPCDQRKSLAVPELPKSSLRELTERSKVSGSKQESKSPPQSAEDTWYVCQAARANTGGLQLRGMGLLRPTWPKAVNNLTGPLFYARILSSGDLGPLPSWGELAISSVAS